MKCSLTNTQDGGSFTHLRILNVFSGYMTLVLSGYAIGVSKVFSGEEKKKTESPFPEIIYTDSMKKKNVHRGPLLAPKHGPP